MDLGDIATESMRIVRIARDLARRREDEAILDDKGTPQSQGLGDGEGSPLGGPQDSGKKWSRRERCQEDNALKPIEPEHVAQHAVCKIPCQERWRTAIC